MRIEPCDTCHGLQIGCYTSDLCVSSHDMYDMRAQCTMFWIPPLGLIFKSNYIKSVLDLMLPLLEHPGHYKGSPRFPSFLSLIFLSIVHHIIPLISMVRCLNLFASSGVMI